MHTHAGAQTRERKFPDSIVDRASMNSRDSEEDMRV
jgi:hypothetical protein